MRAKRAPPHFREAKPSPAPAERSEPPHLASLAGAGDVGGRAPPLLTARGKMAPVLQTLLAHALLHWNAEVYSRTRAGVYQVEFDARGHRGNSMRRECRRANRNIERRDYNPREPTVERTKGPDPQRTGLMCPNCNGPFGEVKKIQLQPRVVTFCCRSCNHEWTSHAPPGRGT